MSRTEWCSPTAARRSCLAAVTLVGAIFWVSPARAHGDPPPLAFWGNFGTGAARCQRVISSAAQLCVTRVLHIRFECARRQLTGDPCDEAGVDDRIQAARNDALDRVEGSCTELHVQNLLYAGVVDASSDVIDVCRSLDSEITSAVYGPVLQESASTPPGEPVRTCVEATAEATARVLGFAVRTRRRTFDEIASRNRSPAEKTALVDLDAERIDVALEAAARRVDALCPEQDFRAIYDEDITAFLHSMTAYVDCLVGAVYVQNGVVCPTGP